MTMVWGARGSTVTARLAKESRGHEWAEVGEAASAATFLYYIFVGARGHNCFLVIYIVFPPGTILDICLIPSPRQARRWESARASTQSTAGPCTQPNSSPPIPSSPTLLLMPEAVTAPNPSGVSRAGRGGRKPGARGPASSSPCVRPSVVFPRG